MFGYKQKAIILKQANTCTAGLRTYLKREQATLIAGFMCVSAERGVSFAKEMQAPVILMRTTLPLYSYAHETRD